MLYTQCVIMSIGRHFVFKYMYIQSIQSSQQQFNQTWDQINAHTHTLLLLLVDFHRHSHKLIYKYLCFVNEFSLSLSLGNRFCYHIIKWRKEKKRKYQNSLEWISITYAHMRSVLSQILFCTAEMGVLISEFNIEARKPIETISFCSRNRNHHICCWLLDKWI